MSGAPTFGEFIVNPPPTRPTESEWAAIRERNALHTMSWPSHDGDIPFPISWAMCSCGVVFGFHPITVDQARECHAEHVTEVQS